MPPDDTYALLDSGHGEKLERFGPAVLRRPCAQAVWAPQRPPADWARADAAFTRRQGMVWTGRERLPKAWAVRLAGLELRLQATDFGHVGVFPEERALWDWLDGTLRAAHAAHPATPPAVLNLFAYSGAVSLVAARAGAAVTHLDAAKGMVAWARDNAAANRLADAPIRWLVDDARRFLDREQRRGRRYQVVVLHPPTYGRGAQGEVFQIERDLLPVLAQCRALLAPDALGLALTCHTPEFTPVGLANVLRQAFGSAPGQACGDAPGQACGDAPGRVVVDEMLLGATTAFPVPAGLCGRWLPA